MRSALAWFVAAVAITAALLPAAAAALRQVLEGVDRGYAVIYQNERGRYFSEGKFEIRVLASGEIVPGNQVFDAVEKGSNVAMDLRKVIVSEIEAK